MPLECTELCVYSSICRQTAPRMRSCDRKVPIAKHVCAWYRTKHVQGRSTTEAVTDKSTQFIELRCVHLLVSASVCNNEFSKSIIVNLLLHWQLVEVVALDNCDVIILSEGYQTCTENQLKWMKMDGRQCCTVGCYSNSCSSL